MPQKYYEDRNYIYEFFISKNIDNGSKNSLLGIYIVFSLMQDALDCKSQSKFEKGVHEKFYKCETHFVICTSSLSLLLNSEAHF